VGDVRDPTTLGAAMREVTTVVTAVHGFAGPGRVSPRSVDRDGNANLVDAALEVGADVVMMSVVGASATSPMELFRAKHEAEQHLRASGAPWTIVRATAFAELWAEIVGKGIVLGRGDNPVNFVSVSDVAAVVERAVVDPGLRGGILEVAGPRDLTFNEFAALLREVRGVPEAVRHVPRWILRTFAPVSRKARAAVTMDTLDMTYAVTSDATARSPLTDISDSLAA
jgi:NADH dehydrogenase